MKVYYWPAQVGLKITFVMKNDREHFTYLLSNCKEVKKRQLMNILVVMLIASIFAIGFSINDTLNVLKEENVIFGGRLAEYKYYDMDKVIESAFKLIDKELN